ncbi:hypothetical protein J4E86_011161 [Alternaria arbusti]|uniref:uncharacterized protein n=1 Tax=Alternaria arbusti TaxID=232088 RepID=UPI00221FC3B0|nr:uncharacterized protein J4E86_011161 [Alternaria arbusti]KAI4940195.1 hypothetical protein J4E86_011161 [Alternaria arbusti]
MSKAQYTKTLWQKEMEGQILSHARAVHAAQIRPTSTLDVVTSTCDVREGNTIHPGYMAHVIMYKGPHKKEWKILTSGEPKTIGGEALEQLLHELQVQLGDSIGEFRE